MTRRRARALVPLLALAAALLTGCGRPLPEVTFLGGGDLVATPPLVWCSPTADRSDVRCASVRPDDQAPRLQLGAGQAVSVDVPAEVGAAPWVVVFRYRDAVGGQTDVRGPLFAAGERLQYRVAPPTPSDQLLRVEVQSGLTPAAGADGVDYQALHTWVVLVQA